MLYKEQTACRACGGNLEIVLDLGEIYPSAFVSEDEPPGLEKIPLILARCTTCSMVQLAHAVDLDSLYRIYFYQSGINSSMVAALKNIVDEAMKLVPLKALDVVVDVGCNDMTLLSFYPEDVVRVGFDPALNLPKLTHTNVFINTYFSAERYPYATLKAKIITSIAMFYDLPDPPAFVRDVKEILDKDGVWIIQLNDLKSMLELNAVDAIGHEHLEYYSVLDITRLTGNEGLQVFRIEHNDVNGGSLRFYVSHAGQRWVEESVMDFLMTDNKYLESPEGSMRAFADRVEKAKDILVRWLTDVKVENKTVYGLAASTKGNTLLQYFGIDSTLLTAIADLNPDKFGKFTVGTNIPIIPEALALAQKPDYLLILAWGFLPFFLKSEVWIDYMKAGGVLVVPLPEPRAYFFDSLQYFIDSVPLGKEMLERGN